MTTSTTTVTTRPDFRRATPVLERFVQRMLDPTAPTVDRLENPFRVGGGLLSLMDADPEVLSVRTRVVLDRADVAAIGARLGIPRRLRFMMTDFVIDMVGGRRIAVTVGCPEDFLIPHVCDHMDIERAYWWKRRTEWAVAFAPKPDDATASWRDCCLFLAAE